MVNDRQFIIQEKPFVVEGWRHVKLHNGRTLSYHNKLNVCTNEDNSALILGYAWQAVPHASSPDEIIQHYTCETTYDTIINDEKTWCGRYLLIVGEKIFTDCVGTMGVYYSKDCRVSNSINILCKVLNQDLIFPDIHHGIAPDFVLGELTPYNNIKHLLPSQTFNILTKKCEYRPLLPDGIVQAADDERRINLLTKYYVESLNNMRKTFSQHKIFLALTGGRDSRAVLAMLEKTGFDYETFIAWNQYMSDGDKYIPHLLSKKLNRKFHFLNRKHFSKELLDDYIKHTAGFAVDLDKDYWAYQQYQQLYERGEKLLFLRSSIWEIPNNYYMHYSPDVFDIYKIFPHVNESQWAEKSAELWLNHVKNDPYNGWINSWNLALWELRNGCWTPALEHGYDMMDNITSIQTCNCRLFLSFLFGFQEADRFSKKHEEKIASLVCEKLKGLPFDGGGICHYQ